MRANYMSWSARQQESCDESDNDLWMETEEKHPSVHWWWNQRTVGFKHGAYCYLCDKLIATWDGKYGMTKKARDAVMRHKKWHLEQLQEGENKNV
jgi:hypothetical protein